MSISDNVRARMVAGSWIRKMFEEGIALMQKFGKDNVFDLSLGNPVMEPPIEFDRELRKLVENPLPGMHRYMENAGYPETRAAVAAQLSLETSIKFTLNDIITLGSIIEGEAMIDSEMPIISSVYHNRLRTGMLLQADPTIQYIIPDGPRRLLNKDLEIDSPYNTYRYAGLPPGPISNPSKKAVIAALRPADTKYFYFVANGDGSHTFSPNLRQHLRAKQKFDRLRRELYRKKQEK